MKIKFQINCCAFKYFFTTWRQRTFAFLGNFTDYDSMFKIYESKVIFALKLGYSESLLQCALRKLGLQAGENQILEELIRLQRSKHFFRTTSPMGKQDERGSSFSIRSDSGELYNRWIARNLSLNEILIALLLRGWHIRSRKWPLANSYRWKQRCN